MTSSAELYDATLAGLAEEFPILGVAFLHHHNMRGAPISFRGRPFLIEMYADFPRLEGADVKKATQTGQSEFLLQLAFGQAGWKGRIVAYVLPTYPLRDRFVQTRVDPLLTGVPAYRKLSPAAQAEQIAELTGKKPKKGAENLKIKRFGPGSLLFLGANTSGDFIEFSADTMILDEYDECEKHGEANIAMARDRLREGVDPQLFRLGNPDHPRKGVTRLYEMGDQRRYHWRCGPCGEWQPIDWFENVVERDGAGWVPRDRAAWKKGDEIRPVCRRCRKPFEREAEASAWVPLRPSEKRRSYWMSRLDVLRDSFRKLFEEEWITAQGDSAKLKAFHRGVLGIAYEPEGGRITQELLDECSKGPENEWTGLDYPKGPDGKPIKMLVTMGIDVGSLLHVTISEILPSKEEGVPYIRRARFVGAFRTFEELQDAVLRYHVRCVVIDEQPELRKAAEFRDWCIKHGVVAWLCRFHPTERVGSQAYGMALKYDTWQVQADRTQLFDASFDDLRYGRRVFPVDASSVLGWTDQMKASVRKYDEDKGRIVWEEGAAEDHFRLADCYDRLAFDVLQLGGAYYSGTPAKKDED